jgi:hypothetical protein
MEICEKKMVKKGKENMENEVECIDVKNIQENSNKAEIVAVGLWNEIYERILSMNGIEEVKREFMGGEIIKR